MASTPLARAWNLRMGQEDESTYARRVENTLSVYMEGYYGTNKSFVA